MDTGVEIYCTHGIDFFLLEKRGILVWFNCSIRVVTNRTFILPLQNSRMDKELWRMETRERQREKTF